MKDFVFMIKCGNKYYGQGNKLTSKNYGYTFSTMNAAKDFAYEEYNILFFLDYEIVRVKL